MTAKQRGRWRLEQQKYGAWEDLGSFAFLRSAIAQAQQARGTQDLPYRVVHEVTGEQWACDAHEGQR
jgi:hypothetical protein